MIKIFVLVALCLYWLAAWFLWGVAAPLVLPDAPTALTSPSFWGFSAVWALVYFVVKGIKL